MVRLARAPAQLTVLRRLIMQDVFIRLLGYILNNINNI